MSAYDPWAAMADFEQARIVYDDLPAQRRGEVHFASQTITLHVRLGPIEQRCTLAHELVHLERGPVLVRHTPREERVVAAIAARRLVDLDALAESLRAGRDEQAVAEELGVDLRTVRVRLRSLTDDERAYLASRIDPAPAL